MAKFQEFKATFKVKGHDEIKILIYHDLPPVRGLSISDAFDIWLYGRAEEYTSEDLCRYINSKFDMTGNIAYTEEEFNKLKEK